MINRVQTCFNVRRFLPYAFIRILPSEIKYAMLYGRTWLQRERDRLIDSRSAGNSVSFVCSTQCSEPNVVVKQTARRTRNAIYILTIEMSIRCESASPSGLCSRNWGFPSAGHSNSPADEASNWVSFSYARGCMGYTVPGAWQFGIGSVTNGNVIHVLQKIILSTFIISINLARNAEKSGLEDVENWKINN